MAIKKTNFNQVKEKFSTSAKYKPQRFFDLGGDFLDAVGLPGPAIGHLNMFLGHSDTGKTTALVKTAVDAQKKGILPVFIITEQKWSFDHAKLMGFQCEEIVDEDTGELDWDGFYIFNNNFDYIEQITDYINSLLDAQEKGELDYSLLFLWDSVGSVPCKMTFEGKNCCLSSCHHICLNLILLVFSVIESRFSSKETKHQRNLTDVLFYHN